MNTMITIIARVAAIRRPKPTLESSNPLGLIEPFISLEGEKAELKAKGPGILPSLETANHSA